MTGPYIVEQIREQQAAEQSARRWRALSAAVTVVAYVLAVWFAARGELHAWNGLLIAAAAIVGLFGVAAE